jgi:erythromycin esterase-like protein
MDTGAHAAVSHANSPLGIPKLESSVSINPLDTEEMLSTLAWMRAYNKIQPAAKRLQIFGFDMQQAKPSIIWLERYFSQRPAHLRFGIDIAKGIDDSSFFRELVAGDIEKLRLGWLGNSADIERFLEANRSALVESSGLQQFEFALQTTRNLQQKFTQMGIQDFQTSYAFRDRSMADTVAWFRAQNGNARAMLWAHNGHIGNGAMAEDGSNGQWMGRWLRQRYGNRYYAIGFQFNAGGFVAHRPASNTLPAMMSSFAKSLFADQPWLLRNAYVAADERHKLASAFSRIGPPAFYLPVNRVAATNPARALIDQTYSHYEAGAVFIGPESATWNTNLIDLFDGIIHLDRVSPARNRQLGTFAD